MTTIIISICNHTFYNYSHKSQSFEVFSQPIIISCDDVTADMTVSWALLPSDLWVIWTVICTEQYAIYERERVEDFSGRISWVIYTAVLWLLFMSHDSYMKNVRRILIHYRRHNKISIYNKLYYQKRCLAILVDPCCPIFIFWHKFETYGLWLNLHLGNAQ